VKPAYKYVLRWMAIYSVVFAAFANPWTAEWLHGLYKGETVRAPASADTVRIAPGDTLHLHGIDHQLFEVPPDTSNTIVVTSDPATLLPLLVDNAAGIAIAITLIGQALSTAMWRFRIRPRRESLYREEN